MKLIEQCQQQFTLLVSLARNDAELARAAMRGGAHGVKVHINVEHFASGTKFGSLEEEHENLARIVEVVREKDGSIGIVPGGNPFASQDDFAQLSEMGVDYFDAYPADAPAWTLAQKDLDVMLAAFHGAEISTLQKLETLGMTLCEASIMHHDDYGKDLSALDLARYAELAQNLKSPIIIPSQKKIVPRDVEALKATGARALLIGAIVTGRDADSVEAAARAFSKVL